MSRSPSTFSHPPSSFDYWHFFVGFLRRPLRVGAVAPSSSRLARIVLDRAALRRTDTVVELGAGTGAITRHILGRLGPRATFIALELDGGHVQRLRQRHSELNVYQESAENLRALLARRGCDRVDCIISGLPWGNMNLRTQERILDEVVGALKPGGRFCGFGYLHASWYPSSRAFRGRLREHFSHVGLSPVIWRNLPPAFVFSCR